MLDRSSGNVPNRPGNEGGWGVQGVYCGGMHHANCLVKEGAVAPHRFRLLAGYVGWGPGMLNEELLEGRWWALSASAPLIISFLQGVPHAPCDLPFQIEPRTGIPQAAWSCRSDTDLLLCEGLTSTDCHKSCQD